MRFEVEKSVIKPNEVAFDVDGVIADTMALFIEIAKKDYNINSIKYQDMTCYSLDQCLDLDEEIITSILNQIIDGN